jgi:hypothetical protein
MGYSHHQYLLVDKLVLWARYSVMCSSQRILLVLKAMSSNMQAGALQIVERAMRAAKSIYLALTEYSLQSLLLAMKSLMVASL